MTVFKLASTALASASIFAMSSAAALAMGGRSGRPGESYGAGNSMSGGASAGNVPPGLSTSNPGMGMGNGNGPGNVASVPEIDASTGLLAMAAVLAIVAFMWERNRRQKA